MGDQFNLKDSQMTLEARITTIVRATGADIKLLTSNIGNLTNLDTTIKTSIVNAINELKYNVDLLNSSSAGINDTAGDGATSVMWSADKIFDTIQAAKLAIENDLVNGAGPALDTLKELQDALAGDPNFAVSISNALSLCVRVDAPQVFDSTQKTQGRTNIDTVGEVELITLQTNIGQPNYDFADVYRRASSISEAYRTYAKLDPSRTSTAAVLESSMLSVSTSQYGCTISDIGKVTGKWYFEVICIDASQKATLFGVVNTATYNKNIYPGAPGNGWCYYFYNGGIYTNDIVVPYTANPTYNQWVGCYFDADAKTVGFIYNGVDYGIAFTGLIGTLHAIIGNGSSVRDGIQTINFGATPFAYNPPAGYNRGLYQ